MSILKVDTIQKADGTGSLSVPAESGTVVTTASPSLGRRNLIINGAMQVAQRGTSFSLGTSNTYTLDRWTSNNGSSFNLDVTLTQSTEAPDGFSHSLKIVPDTTQTPISGQNGTIAARLEGQDLQHFGWGTSSAKDVTLSFWVRSNKTGIYSVQPYTYGSSNNSSGVFTYTINTADTWEYKTINFGTSSNDIVNTSAKGIEIFWHLACGSGDLITPTNSISTTVVGLQAATGQVNFMDSTSNTFYITGVQLEVGSVATPFEHRSYGEELALCQRYFQRIEGPSGAYMPLIPSINGGTANARVLVPLAQSMRNDPSIGYSSAGALAIRNRGSFTMYTSTSITLPTEKVVDNPAMVSLSVGVSSGLTAAEINIPYLSLGAYLDFDSEL